MKLVTDMPVHGAFHTLALKVERSTRQCGPDFRWLRVQTLRSSEAVCANMAEWFYSQYSTEYLQSLCPCRREARETTAHLQYAVDVRQVTEADGRRLLAGYEEALAQLTLLIWSIERKISDRGEAKPSSVVREESAHYGGPVSDGPNPDCDDGLPIDH
jgi:four helix bundle protein